MESERDSAKVEVTRSNRVRSSRFMWAVAQLAEHCTVTAVVASSSLVSPPKQSSKFKVQNNKFRNCGREVRHLVVNQADDGSSPFSSAKCVGSQIGKAPAS